MTSLFSPTLQDGIEALQCLPGVGPKSAQRMLFHLLSHDRAQGLKLIDALQRGLMTIHHCQRCQMLTEQTLCQCCQSNQRDARLLCVVSAPSDVLAIEQTGRYHGYYFVLLGQVSPIDGVGPEEVGFDKLKARLSDCGLEEVILAMPSTVEGEATAFLVSEAAKAKGLSCTRLAQGVPVGSDLSFVDMQTLSCALTSREQLDLS